MAFPQVAAVNGGNESTNVLEHTINLPADISAGDLLLVLFSAGGSTPFTITFPEGWTELYQGTDGTYIWHGCWYRVADGEEEATITVTTSNISRSSHTSYRITGYSGTPEAGTAVVDESAIPNPPSLTPSWGAKDTLWFAICGYEAYFGVTVTAYPTSYTDGRDDYPSDYRGQGTGSARRELNAVSENPGVFTLSALNPWVANTVAIQPVVITPKTSSDTGSGVDAKKTGEPKAAYSRSETGGGVDGHKALAPQSAGETGSGVDALTALLGILARSETGLGTDAKLSLLAALIKADAGSGVEHILDRALVLTEAGLGAETVLALLGKLVSDSGTGVENSYLHILTGVRSSADSGSGVEASSLATLFQRDETGEGAETVAARALFSREPQMGAIDLARVITAAITGAETGTGAEASLMAYYQKKADSGAGVDASTLAALFTGEDSGAGAEAITLLAAMLAADSGVAVESVLSYLRKLVDSGVGEEVVNIIGYVGRAMKMFTYNKPYSDLVVYTRPYSELTVYTSETKL